METGSPSITKILTMVLFALSCIGLTLFLWLSFGGTIPFTPRGYEVRVSFTNASQLADQADVRIAGVSVGKVIRKSLDPQGNRTIATIQLNNKFAPIHKDAQRDPADQDDPRRDLRRRSRPGTAHSPTLPDGGCSRAARSANAVQLDQIFNALDPHHARGVPQWQQQLAIAVKGNDQNLNNVLGNLPTFAADASTCSRCSTSSTPPSSTSCATAAPCSRALGQDQTALRNLITSGEHDVPHHRGQQQGSSPTPSTCSRRFLDETKATMARLQSFSQDTDPLVKELEPVAHEPRADARHVRDAGARRCARSSSTSAR